MRYDFEGMPPLQAIVDTMNRSWQKTRAESQMTLGDLIERLEALPRELKIAGIENPHSYRGYYCDLAFEASENSVSVGEQLEVCHEAMGKVFEGYKGGYFMTPAGFCINYSFGAWDVVYRMADRHSHSKPYGC